jgi:acetyl esterase/lipase
MQHHRIIGALLLLAAAGTQAGPLRERLLERRAAQADTAKPPAQGAGQVLRDLAYGTDPRQRFDLYLPAHPEHAPVIFMVHGGGWRIGGKAESGVVENKVPYFTGRGYAFVSINYRMLPDADPLQQAKDVALALAAAQDKAAALGADRNRFILMGHSAGAHLVALLAAEPALAAGSTPWLATVALDSGALDVVRIMQERHLPLYDAAFGKDVAYWRSVSPAHVLQPGARPMLLVCSSQRADSCPQAHDFSNRVTASGARASVLEIAMSHRDINLQVGRDAAYTAQLQGFLDGVLGGASQVSAR